LTLFPSRELEIMRREALSTMDEKVRDIVDWNASGAIAEYLAGTASSSWTDASHSVSRGAYPA